MSFVIRDGGFYLNNRKVFLTAGEIHYFRIQRRLWDKHLEAAREAGLTAVSTYVPWAWHESEEHVFDFEGRTCPERDLKDWLKRCQAHGLYCILKPGPFILAEYRGAGLPDWFMDHYGDEVKMRNRKGAIVQSEGVSLFNRHYLEKVTLWYDHIMPLIRENEISAGGPVIMLQICNEIGVFTWLARQGDYSNAVKDRFIAYLAAKFSGIDELNTLWGTDYKDFAQVELPPDGMIPYASRGDRGRDYEWHCFWRVYYGDYLRMLSKMARDRGVTVPFYHNLPGWIYGHGYEFPVNITMYEDLFGDRSELVFGVDHIPEFSSYRNMHDDRIINDIILAVQGGKPLFAAEFQSGSREYHVVTLTREMELFYKASIANGLNGWNYYMFSQGRNPERKGYSGTTFYWFTPLTSEGQKTAAFRLAENMNKLVRTSEVLIVDARRKAAIGVLFYPPYYATELERPVEEACGLQYVSSAIRRPAWFDGLLKALQVLNIDYDMIDLSQTDADELMIYRQVWAFSTDEMDARDQQTIIDYAKAGGNVILFPYLPDREMSQRPCTVIRDALSIAPSGKEIIDSPLIDIEGLKDIKCANPVFTFDKEQFSDTKIVARTISGAICGFEKKMGRGSLMHLGTWIGYDTESHRAVYEALLKRSGARLRYAHSDNEKLMVRERFTNHGAGMLFIGNYYNEEQTGKVTYTHPETGEELSIPYGQEDAVLWPALYGVITPLCLQVVEGLKILHSTSDILSMSVTNGSIELLIRGDRDLQGEIVFEGENALALSSANKNGKAVKMLSDPQRTTIIYSHEHRKESVITIKTK